MKKIIALLFFCFSIYSNAQITGTITDEKGNSLPYVSIFLENTYKGTTSNELGKYELNIQTIGKHTIVFQNLGFKTQKITVTIEKLPYLLDVTLLEDSYSIKEVVIDPKRNPANEFIKKAIDNKKENTKITAHYTADFYSRGILRIKNAPKSILGHKMDLFDEVLDSTRSGILYLSETVSKITFQKPDKMKEVILASKVSGNDNGFSFNNAAQANYDFYENYIPFDINVVSPIADNAFNYYKYKFEGTTIDDNNNQIHKIEVIPKRASEPVMEGYIYIVDDSWAIYAVDLNIKGVQMQNPAIDVLTIKQNFSYNTDTKIWVKNTQTVDFIAGFLGINISGKFTYVYTNFEFDTALSKKFSREILSVAQNANKKEDSFWNSSRPVPLTLEESNDYLKKEALQTRKKSQVYLDSIDKKSNKFSPYSPVYGYTYKNSFRKWYISYEGLQKNTNFNTVQGWKINPGFLYVKKNEEDRTYTRIGAEFDYGFTETKLRASANFTHKFSNITQSKIIISGGSKIVQFNSNNPIQNSINSISSLFFKSNYIKLYNRNFINLSYGQEVTNGIMINANIDYSERNPLYNNSNHTYFKIDKLYTSNNPLLPYDYTTAAFEKHNLMKASLSTKINFGQQYWTRPDGKFNIRNDKYPTITIDLEKAFAGSQKKYEFESIATQLYYDYTIGNKGNLAVNLKAGKFFNADAISFVDYKHFNGNQTHIGQTAKYLDVFNLLPYYTNSTNDSYFEAHIEHNDKGYIMNKLPLLKYLKSTLVLGYHTLAVPNTKPYSEFTIGLDDLGFGKFKVFRMDYVRSYQNGYQGDGIIFGLKLLNIIE